MYCNFEFIETDIFREDWGSLGYSEDHYRELTDFLMEMPEAGNIIRKTGGVRKLRWKSPDGKGKRGGSRIIFYAKIRERIYYFLMAYPKSKKVDLTEDEKKFFKENVSHL